MYVYQAKLTLLVYFHFFAPFPKYILLVTSVCIATSEKSSYTCLRSVMGLGRRKDVDFQLYLKTKAACLVTTICNSPTKTSELQIWKPKQEITLSPKWAPKYHIWEYPPNSRPLAEKIQAKINSFEWKSKSSWWEGSSLAPVNPYS